MRFNLNITFRETEMVIRAGPGSGFNPESGSNWHPGPCPGSNQIGIRVRVRVQIKLASGSGFKNNYEPGFLNPDRSTNRYFGSEIVV